MVSEDKFDKLGDILSDQKIPLKGIYMSFEYQVETNFIFLSFLKLETEHYLL